MNRVRVTPDRAGYSLFSSGDETRFLRKFPSMCVSLVFVVIFGLTGYSCDEDAKIGVPPPQGGDGSDDSDGSNDDEVVDDDNDGLGNDVETAFRMQTRQADSDRDEYSDGLEFVGENGDPLNSFQTPSRLSRARRVETASVTTGDSDGDGLMNSYELDTGLNPDNPDTDADGYADGLELVASTNPCESSDRPRRVAPPVSDGRTPLPPIPPDRDRDGLADELERNLGGDPESADTDRDGFSDGIEYLMGSEIDSEFSIPNFPFQECTPAS